MGLRSFFIFVSFCFLGYCCGFVSCNKVKKTEIEEKQRGETLVRIGNTEVTVEEFRAFISSLPDLRRAELIRSPEKMTQAVVEFIEAVATYEYAKSKGYFDRPEIKIRWIYNSAELVRSYIFSEEVAPYIKVDFQDVQDFYNNNKQMFWHPDVIRLMKIESSDKKEIDEIRSKIKDVKDFINIAQTRHLPADFDYGYLDAELVRRRFPEYADIILKMKPGEISRPMKFGEKYIIFAVVDKVDEGYWEFEKVIDQVFRAVREKKIKDRISNLTKELIMSKDVFVNFDSIEKNFGVKLSREKFEEMFMQKYK
jgi:DNA polymerase III delta prime subunit